MRPHIPKDLDRRAEKDGRLHTHKTHPAPTEEKEAYMSIRALVSCFYLRTCIAAPATMLLDTRRTPMGKIARPSVGGAIPIGAPVANPGVRGGLRVHSELSENNGQRINRWLTNLIRLSDLTTQNGKLWGSHIFQETDIARHRVARYSKKASGGKHTAFPKRKNAEVSPCGNSGSPWLPTRTPRTARK